MYRDLSFVLATRVDGYGCRRGDDLDEVCKKRQVVVDSVQTNYPGATLVLVDMFSDGPALADVLSLRPPTTILTVPKRWQRLLMEDSGNEAMAFYEFLGKDLGIRVAVRTPYFAAVNQDCIIKRCEDKMEALRRGAMVLARRRKVLYGQLIEGESQRLVDQVNDGEIRGKHISYVSNGDYLAWNVEAYVRCGGYKLCHQQWAIDNEILYRLGMPKASLNHFENDRVSMQRLVDIYHFNHPKGDHGRPRGDHNAAKVISTRLLVRLYTEAAGWLS